jgi:RNA polymerase sigma factor (TIGR02999 family)
MGESQPSPLSAVTDLLHAARRGDREARDRLLEVVYGDLRHLAARELRRKGGERTLQATALVHEAYLKIAAGGAIQAEDRLHLLALAARAMRQVLVDRARRSQAAKRGGAWVRTTLSDRQGSVELDPAELLALDQALSQLEARQRQVVELRFFGGLEETEVAEVLGVSDRTVRREWVKARARLYRTLYVRGEPGGAAAPAPAERREPLP